MPPLSTRTLTVVTYLPPFAGKTGLAKFDVDKRRDAINARRKGDDVPPPSSLGKTCLIACPASVVHNWEREFQTVRCIFPCSPSSRSTY